MYDTIGIKYVNSNPEVNLIFLVQNKLDHIITKGISIYGEYIVGYIGTLKIKVYSNMLLIKDCSISKYYLGNNIEMMSCGDMKNAIKKISEKIQIDLDNAVVTRIDFGFSIVTKNPTKTYLPYLGQSSYLNRLEQPNGLYYENGLKQLVIYDKAQEVLHCKGFIPEIFTGKNLTRIELRLKRRVAKQLKTGQVMVSDLYDQKFYRRLVCFLKKEFCSIRKISSILEVSVTGSKKELLEVLAKKTVQSIGQDKILALIKGWQFQKRINKRQALELRTCIIGLGKPLDKSEEDPLLNELCEKFKQALRFT